MVYETDRAEVNGVGGSESLSKKGQWILPMRCHDGTVSVAMTQAYSSSESNLNIISSDVLSKMGYDLVHNATRHVRYLKDQNPTTSPEGHALIAPDGTAVWLKVIQGIVVLDLVNVTITPDMLPEGEGHVKYRSANAARKTRVEKEARRLKIEEGISYNEALNKAKRKDQGRCAELYLTSQDGIGGNAFGKPSSVNRI